MTIDEKIEAKGDTLVRLGGETLETRPKWNERFPVRSLIVVGDNKYDSIIKRPDQSIGVLIDGTIRQDYNYGMYLVPSEPTIEDEQNIVWKDGTGFLIRGNIVFENITIDCNMSNQTVTENIEHSAMIALSGASYTYKDMPVCVSFESVRFTNILLEGHGYADDIWIHRGYFRPNIEDISFENVSSGSRVNGKRANIGFSGFAKNAYFNNCNLYKIESETMSWMNYKGVTPPHPANLHLNNVKLQRLDLACKGKSINMYADNLRVTESAFIYQVGGIIKNSQLVYDSAGALIRLNNIFIIDTRFFINPILNTNGDYGSKGLNIRPDLGDNFEATFQRCDFLILGDTIGGRLFYSEYSPNNGYINITCIDCNYDERFTSTGQFKSKGTYKFIGGNYGAISRAQDNPDTELIYIIQE